MLSGVTKAFGDTSAKAMQRVSDLAFKTVELGETSFPELAASMGQVNALAQMVGLSQEEMFAVMATGTGPLGNTARVATKLKAVLTNLSKPTKSMSDVLEKMGYSNGIALVKAKGFQGALQALAKGADASGVQLSKLFESSEGLQIALMATGVQAGEFATKLEKLGKASGSTDKAFDEIAKGVNSAGFSFEQFKTMLEVVRIEIGQKLAPVFAKVLMKIKPLLDVFLGLDDRTKGLILVFAGVAAAIGPLLMIIGPIISGIAALSGTIASAGGVVALLSNPIGWVISAIMLLVAAVIAMKAKFGMSIKSIGAGLLFLAGPIGWVVAIFMKNWSKVLPFLKLIGLGFKALGTLILYILWPVFKALELLGDLFGWVTGLLLDLLTGLTKLVLPKWLEDKIGLSANVTSDNVSAEQLAGRAGAVNKNENATKITIEDRAGVKLRTETEKGTLDTEVMRGLGFQGAY
jgi:TP901 family phage tail tape measure protein